MTSQTLQQPAPGFGSLLTAGAVATGVYQGNLIAAYAVNGSGLLNIATSYDAGAHFNITAQVSQAYVGSSPSLVVQGNSIYVYYRDPSTQTVKQVNSLDGVNFTNPVEITLQGNPLNCSTPVSAVNFNGSFWVAYADSVGNERVAQTDGNIVFQTPLVSFNYPTSNAPSLVQALNGLQIAYQAPNHMLVVNSSLDGVTWSSEFTYPGILMGSAPNLVYFRTGLTL